MFLTNTENMLYKAKRHNCLHIMLQTEIVHASCLNVNGSKKSLHALFSFIESTR